MNNIKISPDYGLEADFDMPADTAIAIVQTLKKFGGLAVQPMDGDCSVQVRLLLADGRSLRFGYTDSDCCDNRDALWIDQYPAPKYTRRGRG